MALALGDTNNWNLFYTGTFTPNFDPTLPESEYGYIGEVVIPLLFDSPYLTVKATSPDAKPSWKQLGFARQKIRVGIQAGGGVDAFINQRHLLSLNQPTLLAFDPNIASTYALSVRPFNWFKTVGLYIYEYTGTL
ncbi:hypothetical protein [uncultured Nostoc sp.]|uniref:hypothetical protein n=1 Tax=uncultured Nostoc sp. TaxID=340711 RepID=UPI0035CBF3A6